jgi:dTDP-4-dehydrorhamnose reductase
MSVPKITTGPILLTGATGQVGGELLNTLSPLGEVIAPLRSTLDLADIQSIRDTIRTLRPRWIVNPAAYTAVDKAESEPEQAYAINRDAVRAIGEEAHTIGAGVIHFSTDYVFDGTGTTPYVETDATNPVSVYGASKLAGEQALTHTGAAHLIFRTSWVYASRGKNFLLTILKLASERDRLRIVADQHGAPTWSHDLARMTAHVISQMEAAAAGQDLNTTLTQYTGTYHAAAFGETTWHGFASEAVRQQRERHPDTRLAEIDPILSAEYPTPAKRPANSRLNCAKLEQHFGWRMPDWHQSLHDVLDELK